MAEACGRGMLGILPHADIQLVLVDDGGSHEIVGYFPVVFIRTLLPRITVELPDEVAAGRFQTVNHAVAAGKDDLPLAVDLGVGWVGPLAVDDLVPRQVALPRH